MGWIKWRVIEIISLLSDFIKNFTTNSGVLPSEKFSTKWKKLSNVSNQLLPIVISHIILGLRKKDE